jgi:NAD(P)-dependent dehydrogenase (short-subunit alcohol dehydrogenase family)
MNFKDKIVLITGASSGIGFDLSKKLLALDAHVIALGKNKKKLQALEDFASEKDYQLTTTAIDLKDLGQITQLSNILTKRFKKLDVLIANAAIIGEITPLNQYSAKIWQEVIFTNLTANWLLIRNFDYLLRQAKAAQIIFSTCKMSKQNNAYWGAYLTAKTALQKLHQIYAEENKTTTLKVNLIDPGPCNTPLRYKAFPGENKDLLRSPENTAKIFMHCLTNNDVENGDFLYYDDNDNIIKTKDLLW